MIAIISDIHGNLPALKSVLEDIDRQKCDKIISLGDVAGYYCQINECIQLLRERHIVNILGNHDYYLISGEGCPRSGTANKCLQYQKDIISKENMRWLKSSPQFIDDDYFSFRHGGWSNPLDEYIYDFTFDMVSRYPQTIFASGHTHIQIHKQYDLRQYFNPGSVGQPRDHDPRAAYAILKDNKEVVLHRVYYPVEETIHQMKKCGFEDRISSCLLTGTKIGELP